MLHDAMKLAKSYIKPGRQRKLVCRVPLGTARSGKAQFINRMGRAERQRRLHALPPPSGRKNKQYGPVFTKAEWVAFRQKLAEDLSFQIVVSSDSNVWVSTTVSFLENGYGHIHTHIIYTYYMFKCETGLGVHDRGRAEAMERHGCSRTKQEARSCG